MRELPQFRERRLRVCSEFSKQCAERFSIGVDELTREPELHRERDEVLLRAVVQVAFDLAPRLVGRRNNASTGGLQFLVRDSQLVE